MYIDLDKLNYQFTRKPLLVGGRAMEYYGLRKSGVDIDLIAPETDIVELIKQYPSRVKRLWTDLGVCPFEFEIWRTIHLYDYDYLNPGAIDEGNILIISLNKLLFPKALAITKEKYLKDTQLIVEKMLSEEGDRFKIEEARINNLLSGIKNIVYIEKTGLNRD